jgi:hypothetical protein
LGAQETRKLRKEVRQEQILGEADDENARAHAVFDALPRVIVDRFRKMIPADYEVKQVEIKVQLSGSPFGVGIAGDATVTFGPKHE